MDCRWAQLRATPCCRAPQHSRQPPGCHHAMMGGSQRALRSRWSGGTRLPAGKQGHRECRQAVSFIQEESEV